MKIKQMLNFYLKYLIHQLAVKKNICIFEKINMVTRDQLLDLDFYCGHNNINEFFYDDWEYMFVINEQSLYFINDGVGQEEFISKIKNIDHLVEVLNNLGYEIELKK